ncbi:MAG: type II toxin-antitoxin system HicB family antitoxin [Anaerolineae bacterium]|nr:type II toxin-antitoxin system HicB family antitoxin [Anaerolineae bacterium]
MLLYDLRIELEELKDGGDYRYMATSPDLPGLLVAGETTEEVLALAPQVAAALIASMKEAGDPLPDTVRTVTSLPFRSRLAVPA